MILLVVWDGLRPDLITPEITPHLARRASEGALGAASHCVWPSATRINSAALTTGCEPSRHGLVDNELYVPAVDPQKPISCADWRALQAMADAEGGRLVTAPTLGEVLRAAGRRMVSGGSGSPGTTYLTNPTVTGPIVNWAVAWPRAFQRELESAYGALCGPDSDSSTRNRFVIDVLRDRLIPAHRPDVVTLWLTEPDHSQHYHGILSAEARAMLSHVDAEVDALAHHLAATQDALTCVVLSDHGFDTIGPRASVAEHLVEAGLKASVDSTDVVVAGCSVYVAPAARERLGAISASLLSQPFVAGVFARDDLLGACPGTLPQSAVGGGHTRSAELMFSYQWSDAANQAGVPGTVHGGGLVATHGSTSPFAMRNTLVAWGQGVRRGVISAAPCGIIDVAPTVLHLLGIPIPGEMQGRVLAELLEDGPDPHSLPVTRHAMSVTSEGAAGGRQMIARYTTVRGHRYLDQVSLTDV